MVSGHPLSQDGERARLKRPRPSEDTLEQDISWTAARCNRLLRTIVCRITTLRRLHSSRSKSGILNAPKTRHPHTVEHWSTADPAWLPAGTRKLQTKTYATKAKDLSTRSLPSRRRNGRKAGDDASFPSPLLRRMGSSSAPEPVCSEDRPLEDDEIAPVRKRRSRKLPLRAADSAEDAEKGLQSAWETLLNATKEIDCERRIGASTLLSTCLRNVPSYVRYYTVDDHDGGTSDPVLFSEVLADLETLGSHRGGGWDRLRDVVRSEGLQTICQAIRDHAVRDDAVNGLINVCSRHRAVREGQQILEAWLSRDRMLLPHCVAKLNLFTKLHHCDDFRFRILGKLMRQDNHMMVSNLPDLETDLLVSLSEPTGYEAATFLREWVRSILRHASEGQLTKRSAHIFDNVVTKLAVVAVADLVCEKSPLNTSNFREAIKDSCSYALLIAQDASANSVQRVREVGGSLICANHLLAVLSPRFLTERALFAGLGHPCRTHGGKDRRTDVRGLLDNFLGRFVNEFISLNGHLKIGLPEQLLDELIRVVDILPNKDDVAVLKSLGLAMVNELKQRAALNVQTCDQYLQHMTSSLMYSSSPITPRRPSTTAEYHWEDGLCEWIKASPHVVCQNPDAQGRTDGDESIGSIEDDYDRHESVSLSLCSPDVLADTFKAGRPCGTLKPSLSRKKGFVVVRRCREPTFRVTKRLSTMKDGVESDDELSF